MSIYGLKKIYTPLFPDSQLHHPYPKTRSGGSSEFDIFPYDNKPHSAYHVIFMNLKIDEIWRMLDIIYNDIFEWHGDKMTQWWLGFCRLDRGNESKKSSFEKSRREKLARRIDINLLQQKWKIAFGDTEIETARCFLKLMMFFMIFGTKILNRSFMSNEDNIIEFFKTNPCKGRRLWCFKICFGNKANTQSISDELDLIIGKFGSYAKVLR